MNLRDRNKAVRFYKSSMPELFKEILENEEVDSCLTGSRYWRFAAPWYLRWLFNRAELSDWDVVVLSAGHPTKKPQEVCFGPSYQRHYANSEITQRVDTFPYHEVDVLYFSEERAYKRYVKMFKDIGPIRYWLFFWKHGPTRPDHKTRTARFVQSYESTFLRNPS